jgi:hypothetical protein
MRLAIGGIESWLAGGDFARIQCGIEADLERGICAAKGA